MQLQAEVKLKLANYSDFFESIPKIQQISPTSLQNRHVRCRAHHAPYLWRRVLGVLCARVFLSFRHQHFLMSLFFGPLIGENISSANFFCDQSLGPKIEFFTLYFKTILFVGQNENRDFTHRSAGDEGSLAPPTLSNTHTQ